jgi:hypothetical protein
MLDFCCSMLGGDEKQAIIIEKQTTKKMKTYNFSQKYFLFLTVVFMVLLSCSNLDRKLEEPLPEIFLTSVITDKTQTKVEVKGEVAGVRETSDDEFGIVYGDKPSPTVENNKQMVGANNRGFSKNIENLQSSKTYYFRPYLKAGGQIYYGNELISNQVFDARWERFADFPDEIPYTTGILYFSGDGVTLNLINTDDRAVISKIVYYTYNYYTNRIGWTTFDFSTTSVTPGLRNLLMITYDKERTFIGGGYQLVENLPDPKVYNKEIWLSGGVKHNERIPTEGETLSMNIGKRCFVVETRSNGEVWEFTNLTWYQQKNSIFKNGGQTVTFGTSQRGYMLTESKSSTTKGGNLYEYNPDDDSWLQKAPYTGEERIDGIAFTSKNKCYYGLGRSKKTRRTLKDLWEYDPATNQWKLSGYYPGNGNVSLVQIEKDGTVYLGLGYQTNINATGGSEVSGVKDFWKFRP